uniref:Uncharacterized protein n=1 Tax=Panstrongylus lignarius TaxID=156445 RepID=A0A224XSL6_9HEMI
MALPACALTFHSCDPSAASQKFTIAPSQLAMAPKPASRSSHKFPHSSNSELFCPSGSFSRCFAKKTRGNVRSCLSRMQSWL